MKKRYRATVSVLSNGVKYEKFVEAQDSFLASRQIMDEKQTTAGMWFKNGRGLVFVPNHDLKNVYLEEVPSIGKR